MRLRDYRMSRAYQAFPRAMAIAETAWTQNANKDWKNFCERMVTEFERLKVMNTQPCLNFYDVNINTHADENGPLMVLLESFYPNAEIRYTTDGSEPSKVSILYEKPFVLEGNIDLKAAAFKDGKMLGKVAHKPLYGNLFITSGRFRPENIQGVIPMPDGEHYTQMNADGTQIIKYPFRIFRHPETVIATLSYQPRSCSLRW